MNSPTFTIVQQYDSGRLPLYHFDVYRIGDVSEMDEIGYEDCFYGEGVCLLEWDLLSVEILQDKVVIGDIMPLVPGIALTTSIRDFFNGDYLSGAIHMIDAILTAFCIAVGVGTVITIYHFAMGGAALL